MKSVKRYIKEMANDTIRQFEHRAQIVDFPEDCYSAIRDIETAVKMLDKGLVTANEAIYRILQEREVYDIN